MSEYFYKLQSPCNSLENLRNFIKGDIQWRNVFQFATVVAPIEIIIDEPILKLIAKFNGLPSILRFDNNSFYHWHVDIKRHAALNILIENQESHTFFGEKIEHVVGENSESLFKNVQELIYKEKEIYLLDVGKYHSVANLGSYRYVLSINFFKPTTYIEVKNFCIDNNL